MNDEIISTGNPVADTFFRRQIVDDVGLLALVSYLESKGLLDRDEFWDFLNIECKLSVHSIIKASANISDSEPHEE